MLRHIWRSFSPDRGTSPYVYEKLQALEEEDLPPYSEAVEAWSKPRMSGDLHHSPSPSRLKEEEHPFAGVPTRSRPWHRRPLFLIAAGLLSAVVVLGLALGFGLGFGLRRQSSSLTSNTNGTTGTLITVQTPNSSVWFMDMNMIDEPPQTRYYDFVITEATGAPDGVEKTMLVVNGQFPGPTIEANSWDRIVVNVTNLMPNHTALHWHGLYQNGTNYYDGTDAITQCGIPPGESMIYNYTLDDYVGSTWWHAHAGTQYTDGIVGALIIHGKNESVPTYDEDLALQLSDLYHGFSTDLLAYYFTPGGIAGVPGNEPVPDGGTINGVGQYGSHNTSFANYTLEANMTYRLRLINPGTFVAMSFSVDDHLLTVIEADGTPVEPFQVSSLSIAVAQRYSVLLTTNQTAGAYWMRAALDQSAFTYDNPGCQTEIRGVLRYGVDDDTMPDVSLLDNPPSLPNGSPGALDSDELAPVGGGPVPDPTFSTYFEISMQYPDDQDYYSQYLAFINSTSWTPLNNTASLFEHLGNSTTTGSANYAGSQLITTVNDISTVELIIDNLDDGDHPFHLHGYKFWIMAGGSGRYQGQSVNNTAPMLRDTNIIPAYSWIILRFIADNPGYWAFHCHIQWHMAAGMLFQFNVLPTVSSQFEIPQDMIDQCSR